MKSAIVTKLKKTCILSAVLAAAVVLFLYAKRGNAVLASHGGDVANPHSWQLLNPFRSRLPELGAARFLEQFRSGQCPIVLKGLKESAERTEEICSKESRYPIITWKVEARGVDKGRVVIRYKVQRRVDGQRVNDPFWLWVSERDPETWEVTGYEVWY